MELTPLDGVQPRSSVDNILRTIQQHHVQLSLMADTKASILITISSIVLTVALSRSAESPFRPALLTLAASCLVALLLAVFAVGPTFQIRRVERGELPRNLFFFGHFAKMTEAEYMAGLERILADDRMLYAAAIRDIHSMGVFLFRKKYRYLRWAYVALIIGFVAATIVEAWALV